VASAGQLLDFTTLTPQMQQERIARSRGGAERKRGENDDIANRIARRSRQLPSKNLRKSA